MRYRGQDLAVEIASVHAEVNVRLMAFVKSKAVAMEPKGTEKEHPLIPLFTEFALLPLDGDQGKHAVDDSLLVELNVARSSANALLTAERMAQGSAVDDVLTARSDAILHIDPTFSLEIAFFRWLAGAGGRRCCKVVSWMPCRARRASTQRSRWRARSSRSMRAPCMASYLVRARPLSTLLESS